MWPLIKKSLPYVLAGTVGLAIAGGLEERAERDQAQHGQVEPGTRKVGSTSTATPDPSAVTCDACGCRFTNKVGGQ
jgi:hypothetical protein